MYELRQILRYRLSSLIIEAKKLKHENEITLLDKYEAIILEEVKRHFQE